MKECCIKINVAQATETQLIWLKSLFEREIEEAKGAASNEHLFALGSEGVSAAKHEHYAEENAEYSAMLEDALRQVEVSLS